ncbi:alpha/beta hydrolase [Silvibacterium sp.]|uniref:alpha/beta hydrolase n=1 Tax=Silvibacterium sp. TaxID=1964179 RepID=UPI0039E4FED1
MIRRCAPLLAFLLLAVQPLVHAQRHSHEHTPRVEENPCFNPADPTEVPLWRTRAPGAVGDDPCRDVPYLQIFRAGAPSREPRPVMLIIPGGGYDNLTDHKEQAPVAEYFASTLHITTAVLRYRLVQENGLYRYPIPMWDGQRAIRLLRAQAAQFGIDPNHIAVFGFSAGGHLASTLALHPRESFGASVTDEIDRAPADVNLLGLGYPVISMNPAAVPPSGSYKHLLFGFEGRELMDLQHRLSGEENVTPALPPVFLFESMDDRRISPQNSVLFADALRRARVPAEVHLFQHGEHGSGLSIGVPEEDAWPGMFLAWITAQWPQLGRPRS